MTEESSSVSGTKESAPQAPSITEGKMEDFSVDKKIARRLHDAKGSVSEDWYLERIDNANIKMDTSIALVVRERVCDEIKSDPSIHNVTSSVLSPYHLTGKQQGVIIASSMLSRCPQEKLSVPSGSMKKLK